MYKWWIFQPAIVRLLEGTNMKPPDGQEKHLDGPFVVLGGPSLVGETLGNYGDDVSFCFFGVEEKSGEMDVVF